jgi:hypothetical protein
VGGGDHVIKPRETLSQSLQFEHDSGANVRLSDGGAFSYDKVQGPLVQFGFGEGFGFGLVEDGVVTDPGNDLTERLVNHFRPGLSPLQLILYVGFLGLSDDLLFLSRVPAANNDLAHLRDGAHPGIEALQ